MQDDHLSDVRFEQLNLDPRLLANLQTLGFDRCTPIQAKSLPLALAGRDVAGQAQTGTGKTAAFLLAILDRLLKSTAKGEPGAPRSLILAPTRELVVQIHTDAEELARNTGLKIAVVYGGTGYESQRQELSAGVDILIGTPGRLIDYLKQKVYTLRHIEVVVLDEADRMFDLGFISDIRFMLRRMPPATQRSNHLFSATLSHRVMELAYEHMNSPTRVTVETEQLTADRVRQSLIHVANDEKLKMLVGLMQHHAPNRTLVFVNTKRTAEHVEDTLRANKFEASTLSGDVPQPKRLKLLEQFKSGELPVVVATDVAARGLHIDGVTHVINYDLPQDPEDYVHRIGRTARAGAEGDAISLCCETWVYSLPDIERYLGARIPVMTGVDDIMPKDFVSAPRRPRDPNRAPRRGGNNGGGRQRARR